ncbi:MAG: serine--tRNA ligase, partial [Candidatus Nitrosocosmicus sp.]
MIDPRILKENPEQIKEMLAKRNMNIPIDDLFNLDKKRRHMTTELQTLYHKKNLMAKEIAKKRKNKEQTDIDIQKMSNISENIKELED